MYAVKMFPESISSYVSQIYAGLYDLASMPKIHLDFANRFFCKTRKLNKWLFATLRLEVRVLKNRRVENRVNGRPHES